MQEYVLVTATGVTEMDALNNIDAKIKGEYQHLPFKVQTIWPLDNSDGEWCFAALLVEDYSDEIAINIEKLSTFARRNFAEIVQSYQAKCDHEFASFKAYPGGDKGYPQMWIVAGQCIHCGYTKWNYHYEPNMEKTITEFICDLNNGVNLELFK